MSTDNNENRRLDPDEPFTDDTINEIFHGNVFSEGSTSNDFKKGHFKKQRRFSAALAGVLILFLASVTVYAAGSGFEALRMRFNPAFAELATAQSQFTHVVDQGILMEAVGAQQINNVVLVYLTMRDISGHGRINENSRWPDLLIYIDGEPIAGGSSTNVLNFDLETGTLYLELMLVGEVGIPRLDFVEIGATYVLNTEWLASGTVEMETVAFGEWRVHVSTAETQHMVYLWEDISLQVGDSLLSYMALSPFGLQIVIFQPRAFDEPFNVPIVEIEFKDERPALSLFGGSGGGNDNTYEYFYHVDSPIDIGAVSAIIINDVRIPAPFEVRG